MDACSATATFTAGILHGMTPHERKITESSAPGLEQSRFWIVGRLNGKSEHAVLAWSQVRQIAKSIGQLAVAFGLQEVLLVDRETSDEEEIKRTA
jgi:hypothetical protein